MADPLLYSCAVWHVLPPPGENCDLLQCGGEAVMFDYFHDPNIIRNGRMDMLSLKQYK